MSTFRDLMKADLAAVSNVDEFGESVTLSNKAGTSTGTIVASPGDRGEEWVDTDKGQVAVTSMAFTVSREEAVAILGREPMAEDRVTFGGETFAVQRTERDPAGVMLACLLLSSKSLTASERMRRPG